MIDDFEEGQMGDNGTVERIRRVPNVLCSDITMRNSSDLRDRFVLATGRSLPVGLRSQIRYIQIPFKYSPKARIVTEGKK